MTREQIENATVAIKESKNYHMSFEEARKIAEHGGDNYLKTIKIDWEE